MDEFNALRHVGDDSPAQLPPSTPERVAEFFDFLKARIATARKYGPAARDYAVFRTLYHVGLRSEDTSLPERPDVHFSRGPFGELHVPFGKGARTCGPRQRWVPMLDGLDLVLHWFLDDVRGKFPNSPVLFADESGGSLHRGTIRNRLRCLMELEGRPAADRFSPHALRRACATHPYERGVDLVAIQRLLGQNRHWWLLKSQDARGTIFEDRDQPVEDGRPVLRMRRGQIRADSRTVCGMASREANLQLASRLRIAQILARCLVGTPFNNVVVIVGLPEAAAETVGEGVEVLAEVASRAIDRLADESPEVFPRPHLTAVQHVCRRHGTKDTFSSMVYLSI